MGFIGDIFQGAIHGGVTFNKLTNDGLFVDDMTSLGIILTEGGIDTKGYDKVKQNYINHYENNNYSKVINILNKINDSGIFLNKKEFYNWPREVSFVSNFDNFLEGLDDYSIELLKATIKNTPKLTYNHQDIIWIISEKDPMFILSSLVDRKIEDRGDNIYRDADSKFQKTLKVFENNIDQSITYLRTRYNDKSKGLFAFKEAKVFYYLYKDMNKVISNGFIRFIQSNNSEDDIKYILYLLVNYKNIKSLKGIVKEIVKIHHDNEEVIELLIHYVLSGSTGAVWGPHGMSESYKSKVEIVKYWSDEESDENMIAFIGKFVKEVSSHAEDVFKSEQDRETYNKLKYQK